MFNNQLQINHLRAPKSLLLLYSCALCSYVLLRSSHLYYSRARTTNPPYLKKRTQFQKSQIQRKTSYNNELRKIDTWSHRTKRTQTNPIFPLPKQPTLPSFTPGLEIEVNDPER